MENERKVIDNFDNLQIDEKYIDEVFNGQPTLKYADYMPHFSEGKSYNELSNIHRALWSRDLERQYRNIKRQRKDICDLTEKYENEQIDKSEIPNEMLEKYKSKTRYEIQMELGQKIDKLVNRDLVSKDTENDSSRLGLLKEKLDNAKINKIPDENLAEYASKLDIEITKNREILKSKKDLVSKNSQYKGLQQQLEAVKAELKPLNSKPGLGKNRITAEENAKRVNLIQKQALIEAQIQYIDTNAENQAVQMTYDKNKTYSQLPNVDFENVMNKTDEKLQMTLNKYKQALDKMEDFPEDLKNKMYENVSKNIVTVDYTDLSKYNTGGFFYPNSGLLVVDSKDSIEQQNHTLMHEMTHAATYKEDKANMENSRMGFQSFNSKGKIYNGYGGTGINEGMTEYFAKEISKKSNYFNEASYNSSYRRDLVPIAENMVNLYGKDTMLDAMLNGPEKLEELMAKDGKSFTEFREMVDDYYRQVYNNKELNVVEASKTEDAKKMYSNINGYMEEIRSTRLAKEQEKAEEVMYDNTNETAKEENIPTTWFQRAKNRLIDVGNKVKDRFKFGKNSQKLLPAPIETQEEHYNKNEFRDGLKVNVDPSAVLSQAKDNTTREYKMEKESNEQER